MGPNVRKFGEDEEVDQLIRKYEIGVESTALL
jgi:hypothetical protein